MSKPLPSGARKALGSLAILTWLTVYIVVAVMIGERLHGLPDILPLLYYAVAGVAWVLPLRGLFRWMNA
ncbi:MAG: DUF2842 domain-containing protein [Hyphomonadaceae bacterium]|nr:DUF2842 domain-containing protein [Hyphomonadaceae bacterium]